MVYSSLSRSKMCLAMWRCFFWTTVVNFQAAVDVAGVGIKLRTPGRSMPQVTWQDRVCQHLAHRVPVHTKHPGSVPNAHPLHHHRPTNLQIEVHRVHPWVGYNPMNGDGRSNLPPPNDSDYPPMRNALVDQLRRNDWKFWDGGFAFESLLGSLFIPPAHHFKDFPLLAPPFITGSDKMNEPIRNRNSVRITLMYRAIETAIRDRKLITVNYPPGVRVVEPHAYGSNTDGSELLRVYQVSGASHSGEPTGWRLFRVDRIGSLEVLSETFSSPRPGYTRGDSSMTREIFAEL